VGSFGGYTIATKALIKETTSAISEYGDKTVLSNNYLDGLKTSKAIRPIVDATKQQQFQSYRNGKGLLVNFHPVHHAGTTFCGIIGKSGGPVASKRYPEISPSFACWIDRDGIASNRYSPSDRQTFRSTAPVKHNETGQYLRAMRKHFHMVSWEYDGVDLMERNVSETNWEHPDLISVVITREPLSRMMAGGIKLKKLYPGYTNGSLTHAGWWDLATHPKRPQADNFFLRMLAGERKMKPNIRARKGYSRFEFMYTEDTLPSIGDLRGDFDIHEDHYEKAVDMLHRFTVVLDIACLDDGLDALARLLGLNMTFVTEKQHASALTRASKTFKREFKRRPIQEQIGYDDVYNYLLEKHQFDIKLYEYSKTISLVDCNS